MNPFCSPSRDRVECTEIYLHGLSQRWEVNTQQYKHMALIHCIAHSSCLLMRLWMWVLMLQGRVPWNTWIIIHNTLHWAGSDWWELTAQNPNGPISRDSKKIPTEFIHWMCSIASLATSSCMLFSCTSSSERSRIRGMRELLSPAAIGTGSVVEVMSPGLLGVGLGIIGGVGKVLPPLLHHSP